MFDDARLYGLREPEIKDFGTSFRISLKRRAFDAELFKVLSLQLPEKSREKAISILTEISADPHITGEGLGKKLNVSRATIQRVTVEMKNAGILSRKGSNNGGQWVIKR